MHDAHPYNAPGPAAARGVRPPTLESALRHYLSLIERHPVLTVEEEQALASEFARSRDPLLARRLVLGHLRFVVKIALEYRHHPVRLLDLIQEGNLGLLTAVDRFDPSRGVRLNTYSVWWIRAFIQEYIRRSISVVRFGTTRAEQRCFYRLGRERARLAQRSEGGRVETHVLAEALGVSERDLHVIEARMRQRDLSLDSDELFPAPADRGAALELGSGCPGPEALIAEQEQEQFMRTSVQAALARLDPREQAILRARYLAPEKSTLQKLGEVLGISRERVRQLELRAKAKMRKRLLEAPPGLTPRVRRRRAPRRK